MKETIKKSLVGGLVFFTTVLILSLAYAAIGSTWTTPSTLEVGAGSGLTTTSWNSLLANFNNLDSRVTAMSAVPAGAIMAFYLTTCPTGWNAADGSGGRPDLRGEFIRGLDNGRGIDTSRALASAQGATAIQQSIHEARDIVYTNADSETSATYSYYGMANVATSQRKIFTVRPRNIALLYCIKQ